MFCVLALLVQSYNGDGEFPIYLHGSYCSVFVIWLLLCMLGDVNKSYSVIYKGWLVPLKLSVVRAKSEFTSTGSLPEKIA